VDPVSLVVTALVAGAAAGLTDATSATVVEAVGKLRQLVVARFTAAGRDQADVDIVARAPLADHDQTKLKTALEAVQVDKPTHDAAQELLDLLEQQRAKFKVDASNAKGLQIGDHNIQHNNFS
jgi:hypothetical protein